MSVLFLDIDGVLNGHQILEEAGCSGIDPSLVKILNRVLRETKCDIVLSSAWRYMITGKAMTLDGFWYMLRTHGLTNNGDRNPLVGTTPTDEKIVGRGDQILHWLGWHKGIKHWAVVDDDPMGIDLGKRRQWRLVVTEARIGITEANADALIAILNRKAGRRPK